MATSDAGPGYDVVKGYKIPVSNNETFGAFMTSHALQFLFFNEDAISVYYNTQEIPKSPQLDNRLAVYTFNVKIDSKHSFYV